MLRRAALPDVLSMQERYIKELELHGQGNHTERGTGVLLACGCHAGRMSENSVEAMLLLKKPQQFEPAEIDRWLGMLRPKTTLERAATSRSRTEIPREYDAQDEHSIDDNGQFRTFWHGLER